MGQRNAKNQTQKDTNFGNAMILQHFGPEKCQKSAPERHEFRERHNSLLPWARELPKSNHERHEFQKTALIDPSKNANKIRKVFVFQEFCTLIEMHSLTLTNQPPWEHLVACFLQLQTNSNTFRQWYLSAGCHFELLQEASTLSLSIFLFFQKTNLILCSILAQIHSGC